MKKNPRDFQIHNVLNLTLTEGGVGLKMAWGLSHWLYFHSTQLQFPAPTSGLKPVCNCSFRGSSVLLWPPWALYIHMYRDIHESKSPIHTNKCKLTELKYSVTALISTQGFLSGSRVNGPL